MLPYALLTLEELKLYLGITDTSQDALLTMLINQCTEKMNRLVGYTIFEQVYNGGVLDNEQPLFVTRGEDYKKLVLPFRNITDTITFQIERSEIANDGTWEVVEATDYWIDKEPAIVEYNSGFATWYNYRFTFSAGYNPIPDDIKALCMSSISSRLSRLGAEGVAKEKIGDYSIEYSNEVQEQLNLITNIYAI